MMALQCYTKFLVTQKYNVLNLKYFAYKDIIVNNYSYLGRSENKNSNVQ